MATLEAIGALHRFDEVFDVLRYREDREQVMRRLIWRAEGGSGIDKEILQMLKSSGLHVPWQLPGYLRKARSVVGRVKKIFPKPFP